MTNHEAIKKMSVEEMAAMLYIFTKPFMDAFGYTDEQKMQQREAIRKFLTSQVGK